MHPFLRKAFLIFILILLLGLIQLPNPNNKYKSDELKQPAPVVGFEAGLGLVIPEPGAVFVDEEGEPIPIPHLCEAYDMCDPNKNLIVFRAMLPKKIKMGDKIRLKGTVYANAQQFSINLVNQNQQYITYHFHVDLLSETIMESWEYDGKWVKPKIKKYQSFVGDAFDLELAFLDKAITVYERKGVSRKLITKYVPEYELTLVESLIVWGDVEKVTNIYFSYA